MTAIRTPALGILNETDAPHQNMVVAVWGKPEHLRWCYIAPRHTGNSEHELREPELFTPLADFGVHATITPDGRLGLNQLTLSIATTPAGKPRRWQGAPSSIIEVHHHVAGFVMRAVRADFESRREAKAS